jgi:CxxC motif-containing protein (DUF1111 family)
MESRNLLGTPLLSISKTTSMLATSTADLGPVLNGRACAECHQNPVSGGTLLAIGEHQADVSDGRIHGEAIQVPVLEAPGQTRVGRFGWKDPRDRREHCSKFVVCRLHRIPIANAEATLSWVILRWHADMQDSVRGLHICLD